MFRKLRSFFLEEKTSATSKTFLVINGQIQSTDFSDIKNQVEGYNQNVIVYRCIKLISDSIAKIPFILLDKNGEKIESHPLLDLLRKPNYTQSKKEFLESVISNKFISGNAYIEAAYPDRSPTFNRNAPSFLYSLNPEYMKIRAGSNGIPSAYEFTKNGQKVVFPVTVIGDSNILQIKNFKPNDDWYGLSPIQPAAYDIDQLNFAKKWNNSVLKNSGNINGILKTDQTLTDNQFERLQKKLDEYQTGDMKSGKPLILEGGLEWVDIGMSLKDVDFSEGIKMASQFIAYSFGVPYDLVNTDQAKYDNLDRAYELLWDQSVKPNLEHLIDELNCWLVPRYNEDIKISYDEDKVEAIQNKRARLRESLEKVSYMTINEKRRSIGLAPVDGGDQILTEFNKVPLSDVGISPELPEDEKSYINHLQFKGYDSESAKKIAKIVYDHSD